MADPAFPITFATVASRGYIGHAAGLIANLRAFYPNAYILVCALDDATRAAFSATGSTKVTCISASDVWGEDHWRNLTSRMTVPERAFATKSALTVWAVETYDRPVLLLDSDLLFLERIDDIIDLQQRHTLLLVPGRHPWRDWRKTRRFGLFSAGVIGVAPGALTMARAWRAMCFEACLASPFAGVYYEQKYLDYFVSEPGLVILDDIGINVSQTLLRLLAPHKVAEGIWRVGDDVPLRIYHASRSTDEGLELARLKADYNSRGLAALGLKAEPDAPREAKVGGRIGFAALIRALRIGSGLEGLENLLARMCLGLIMYHRVLTLDDQSLTARLAEVRQRSKLQAKLEEQAQVDVSAGREAM